MSTTWPAAPASREWPHPHAGARGRRGGAGARRQGPRYGWRHAPFHRPPQPPRRKEYWPVYAAAERLDVSLAVHGGCHEGMGMDHMNVYAPRPRPRPPLRPDDLPWRHPLQWRLRALPRQPHRFPRGRHRLVPPLPRTLRPLPLHPHRDTTARRRAPRPQGRRAGHRLHPAADRRRPALHRLRGQRACHRLRRQVRRQRSLFFSPDYPHEVTTTSARPRSGNPGERRADGRGQGGHPPPQRRPLLQAQGDRRL